MSDYITRAEAVALHRAVLKAMMRARDAGGIGVIEDGIAALDAQPEPKACAGFVCAGFEANYGSGEPHPKEAGWPLCHDNGCYRECNCKCGLPFSQHAPASAEPRTPSEIPISPELVVGHPTAEDALPPLPGEHLDRRTPVPYQYQAMRAAAVARDQAIARLRAEVALLRIQRDAWEGDANLNARNAVYHRARAAKAEAEVERLEEERSKAERRYADAPSYQAAMHVLHDTRDAATETERLRIAGVLRREANGVLCLSTAGQALQQLANRLERGEA